MHFFWLIYHMAGKLLCCVLLGGAKPLCQSDEGDLLTGCMIHTLTSRVWEPLAVGWCYNSGNVRFAFLRVAATAV